MFESIKNNSDFLKAYRHGKSYANRYLVMYVRKNDLDRNRYGITVSKKVGNSVVRHRVTRLIRESYRLNEMEFDNSIRLNVEKFENGYDIVIIARNTAKGRKCQEIESAVLHLGKLHNIVVR